MTFIILLFIFTVIGLLPTIYSAFATWKEKEYNASKESDPDKGKVIIRTANAIFLSVLIGVLLTLGTSVLTLSHAVTSEAAREQADSTNNEYKDSLKAQTAQIHSLDSMLNIKTDTSLSRSQRIIQEGLSIAQMQSQSYNKQLQFRRMDSLRLISRDSSFLEVTYDEIHRLTSENFFKLSNAGDTTNQRNYIYTMCKDICAQLSSQMTNYYLTTHPALRKVWKDAYRRFSDVEWMITGPQKNNFLLFAINRRFQSANTQFLAGFSAYFNYSHPADPESIR